jgi:hypothetical protein
MAKQLGSALRASRQLQVIQSTNQDPAEVCNRTSDADLCSRFQHRGADAPSNT